MRTYAALALVAALHIATPAQAQEVTLRAVTAFAEKTTYSRGFETFVERVNEAGKGVIRINYIGGPKAMPPFEVGNALKNGVIEIANVTGAFYTNLLPEADAWKLTQRCEAITFDTAREQTVSRRGVRGRLGGRHSSDPGARAEAAGLGGDVRAS
jgi:hypothetical protein